MLKRICRVCGKEFRVPPKQATRAYCDRAACSAERRRRQLAQERRKYRLIKKGAKKVSSRKKPDAGRRCQRCGKNSYPNYFYCPECHRYVSCNEWFKEDEKGGAACGM
jgi:hypothetical protein